MGISWGIARGALVTGFVAEEVDEEGRRLEGVEILRANDDGIGTHLIVSAQTKVSIKLSHNRMGIYSGLVVYRDK